MSKMHIVQSGECMTSIAAAHGFHDWRTVYDDPQNAQLRALRPNPNLLFPKDKVVIPDKETRVEGAATGARHRFYVRRVPRRLRLFLRDYLGAPVAGAEYTLTTDSDEKPLRGTTDAQGGLAETISNSAKEATVIVGDLVWKVAIAALNPMPETRDHGISGVQGRLSNLGYEVGKLDGIMGPKTRGALKKFQEDQGLPGTGLLDDATQAALAAAHKS